MAQELFLRLWKARRVFNPSRGGWEAFVAVLVDRAVIDLLRRQAAVKRNGRLRSRHPFGGIAYNPVPAVDRALDVAAVLARLPADLRAVAERLKGESVAAAARKTGVSRATLRRQVRDVRAAFEKYKLRNF